MIFVCQACLPGHFNTATQRLAENDPRDPSVSWAVTQTMASVIATTHQSWWVHDYWICMNVIIRPPNIVCRRTYILPAFFLLSFFFSSLYLQARWTELNDSWPHARKWVLFENACPKSGVSPLPTNWRPKNHLFGPSLKLNGNFNRLYLPNETWYRQSG